MKAVPNRSCWNWLDQWRSSKQVKETWSVKVEQTSEGDLTSEGWANEWRRPDPQECGKCSLQGQACKSENRVWRRYLSCRVSRKTTVMHNHHPRWGLLILKPVRRMCTCLRMKPSVERQSVSNWLQVNNALVKVPWIDSWMTASCINRTWMRYLVKYFSSSGTC